MSHIRALACNIKVRNCTVWPRGLVYPCAHRARTSCTPGRRGLHVHVHAAHVNQCVGLGFPYFHLFFAVCLLLHIQRRENNECGALGHCLSWRLRLRSNDD